MSAQPKFDDLQTVTFCNLLLAVDRLIEARRLEAQATAHRMDLEDKIARALPPPAEGSQTTLLADGRKLTLTGRLIYKADVEELMRLSADLPANLRPLKTETKADEDALRYLRARQPDAWEYLSKGVSVEPARVEVKIYS